MPTDEDLDKGAGRAREPGLETESSREPQTMIHGVAPLRRNARPRGRECPGERSLQTIREDSRDRRAIHTEEPIVANDLEDRRVRQPVIEVGRCSRQVELHRGGPDDAAEMIES